MQAIAAQFGAVNSGVATAGFIDIASAGQGLGLLGNYWANTSGTAFTNSAFDLAPTLMRTDAVVTFNWSSAGPSTAVGQTNFTARWTGCLQPQYNETYTLTTIAAGGVRLWVNGQLIISAWTINTSTRTNNGSIALRAQQFYNLQLDYFQNTGNAGVELLWSSPSTPPAVIPQSQLYPYTNPPPVVALQLRPPTGPPSPPPPAYR